MCVSQVECVTISYNCADNYIAPPDMGRVIAACHGNTDLHRAEYGLMTLFDFSYDHNQ